MEKTLKAMFNSTFFWGQEDGVDSNGIHKRIKRGTSENGVPRLFFGGGEAESAVFASPRGEGVCHRSGQPSFTVKTSSKY